MANVKKAQKGKEVAPSKKKAAVDSVPSEMFPGKMIPKSAVTQATLTLQRLLRRR